MKLTAKEMTAVVKTIELIESGGWETDRSIADEIRAWMKDKI